MAGFDTNALMPTALPQQTNPLEFASQAIGVRNALLGNQIKQEEFNAKKALGAAYAHHYNALTGQYDMPGVYKDMGATEAGQYGLPEAVTTGLEQKRQGITNDTAQLEQNAKRMGMIAGILAPYANRKNLTKQDLAPAYGSAIAHGIMTIDQANQSYASLPQDGDALKQQVRGLYDAASGPENSYKDAYGDMHLVDVGGHLEWQNVGSPASGQGGVSQGAPIGKTLSPAEATVPQPYNAPDGTPKMGTRADVVRANGQSGYLDTTNKPTVPVDVMGNGRYQDDADPFGGGGSSPQSGGFTMGPAPGTIEAQKATAEASAKAANALMQAASQRNDRMAMLGNMATDLTGFSSGPGYERLRKYAAIFDNWTGSGLMSGQIESAQSFNKWAQQLANAQAQALGASDARLGAAEHANPNSSLQEGTNRMMIHQLMGNEEAINAKAQAWQKSGLPASQYQQWNQNFSQNFDPRAFQLLKMTPEEQQIMFKGMKESGQFDAFRKTYNAMAKAGLVPSGR